MPYRYQIVESFGWLPASKSLHEYGAQHLFQCQVDELEEACVSKADAALVVLALTGQREVALLFQTVQDAAVFVYAASSAHTLTIKPVSCWLVVCGLQRHRRKLLASVQDSAVAAAKWAVRRRGVSAQCSAPWCPAVPWEQRRLL